MGKCVSKTDINYLLPIDTCPLRVDNDHLSDGFAATSLCKGGNKVEIIMEKMKMQIELEKKFLIEYPKLNLIMQKYSVTEYEIEQIYLLSETGSRRIRKRKNGENTVYIETVKVRINGSKCYEYERELSAEEYENCKSDADPKKAPVYKTRYVFPYKNKMMELDVYPFWKDKAVLEIELESEEDEYFIPEEITVIEDVSNDSKYKNAQLAAALKNGKI